MKTSPAPRPSLLTTRFRRLWCLLAALWFVVPAIAQRTSFVHERMEEPSLPPRVSQTGDTVTFVSRTRNGLSVRFVNPHQGSTIIRWHVPLPPAPERDKIVPLLQAGVLLVLDGERTLRLLDLYTGEVRATFPSTADIGITPDHTAFFRWSTADTVERISLLDVNEREFVDTVKCMRASGFRAHVMTMVGSNPAFRDPAVENSSFVVHMGRRIPTKGWGTTRTRWLMKFSGNDQIRLWDPATDDSLAITEDGYVYGGQTVFFSVDGTYVFFIVPGRGFREIRRYDTRKRQHLSSVTINSAISGVEYAAAAPGWLRVKRYSPSDLYIPIALDRASIDSLSIDFGELLSYGKSHQPWGHYYWDHGSIMLFNADGGMRCRLGQPFSNRIVYAVSDRQYLVETRGPAMKPDSTYALKMWQDDGVEISRVWDLSSYRLKEINAPNGKVNDVENLRHIKSDSTGRHLTITDVVLGPRIEEMSIPAPYSVYESFANAVDPRNIIRDSLGVTFLFSQRESRLWTRRPGETEFSMRWNGGQFSSFVLPTRSEHAYVTMYAGRVGRFSRVDGRFAGYLDEQSDLRAVHAMGYASRKNALVFLTDSAVIMWDPVSETEIERIPIPASAAIRMIRWVAANGEAVVVSRYPIQSFATGLLVTRDDVTEIDSVASSSRFLYGGLIHIRRINPNEDGLMIESTRGNEPLDFGQGTCGDAVTFDGDSSVVLLGYDSTIVLRYPLGGGEWRRADTSLRPATSFAPRNVAVARSAGIDVDITAADPNQPCTVDLVDLKGCLHHRVTIPPTSSTMQLFHLDLDSLTTGTYTLSVLQGTSVITTRVVQIH